MITAISGPLVSEPENWLIVFNRKSVSWWLGLAALGHYKHVRAFGYVPFLHVWIFFDPCWSGHDLFVAADGEPARRVIAEWIEEADVIRMPARPFGARANAPLLGWCVPSIKRLIGLRTGALRPDRLFADCLAQGGQRFEHGSEQADDHQN